MMRFLVFFLITQTPARASGPQPIDLSAGFSAARMQLAAFAAAAKNIPQRPPPADQGEQIMILEYHKITVDGRWSRSPQGFAEDLLKLWKAGFYLTNLNDVIDGSWRDKVPAGKAPVVLTFDDSAAGQFYLDGHEDDPGDRPAPGTAVTMILDFTSQHSDFGRAATFFLNPDKHAGTVWSPILKFMVASGFELGNHTVTHPKLKDLTDEQVQQEIVDCQNWIEKNVPGYRVRTFALPFGIYPKNDALAMRGAARGTSYEFSAVLMVGSAPLHVAQLNSLHVPRVQVWPNAPAGQPVFSRYFAMFEDRPDLRALGRGPKGSPPQ